MFYVISYEYVGPARDKTEDAHIEISTEPARKNSSREICLDGWCGTTCDVAEYAHGEYETVEQARAAIKAKFGDVREADVENFYNDNEENLVEVYYPGKYNRMNLNQSETWVYEEMNEIITAETTDEQLTKLLADLEQAANREGDTLHPGTVDYMRAHRQELRDSVEEEGKN